MAHISNLSQFHLSCVKKSSFFLLQCQLDATDATHVSPIIVEWQDFQTLLLLRRPPHTSCHFSYLYAIRQDEQIWWQIAVFSSRWCDLCRHRERFLAPLLSRFKSARVHVMVQKTHGAHIRRRCHLVAIFSPESHGTNPSGSQTTWAEVIRQRKKHIVGESWLNCCWKYMKSVEKSWKINFLPHFTSISLCFSWSPRVCFSTSAIGSSPPSPWREVEKRRRRKKLKIIWQEKVERQENPF